MRNDNEIIIRNLSDQLRVLANSCIEFDKGYEEFGREICTKLRVIFHQTTSSHSILNQLQMEDQLFQTSIQSKVMFWMKNSDQEVISNQYFLLKEVMSWDGRPFSNFPHLDDIDEYKALKFEDWWKEIVCKYSDKTLTRRQLVLLFSNKLGGAHLEPNLNKNEADIHSLTSEVLFFQYFNNDGTPKKDTMSPYLATARQIAHETLRSFEKLLPGQFRIPIWYDSPIEHYKLIGHNRSEWYSGVFGEKVEEVGSVFIVGFASKNVETVCALVKDIYPRFDVSDLEYAIEGRSDGFISIREKGIVHERLFEYSENDRFGLGILNVNGKVKICYLHKEVVFYISQTTPKLPLYNICAMKQNGTLKYPQGAKGKKLEDYPQNIIQL